MTEESETERRLTELEVKLSFTEDTLDQLNHTIFRQQQQMDLLLRELAELRRQMPVDPGRGGNPRDELPPHY
ncbi:SlyX family protein [Bordetella sp. FB-8]|uniref:SlyX family protein n=1 Tax=Bordetella sp. FB-8 TaxID=1159870 RepID=UPI00035E6771|nr:SlyX family protein [Bordetella sp. FB-8]